MSGRGRGGRGRGGMRRQASNNGTTSNSNSNSEIHRMFGVFSKTLDARNDERELIYTRAREVTRSSKKVISLLQRSIVLPNTPSPLPNFSSSSSTHTTNIHDKDNYAITNTNTTTTNTTNNHTNNTTNNNDTNTTNESSTNNSNDAGSTDSSVLITAQKELRAVCVLLNETYSCLSSTLSYYRLQHNLSPGVQELIEALGFYWYLEYDRLISLNDVQTFIEHAVQAAQQPLSPHLHVTPIDYVLGIFDVGGELMRFATNSLNVGAFQNVSRVLHFLLQLHAQLQTGTLPRFIVEKKMEVLTDSLNKLEVLSYRMHLREAEHLPMRAKSLLSELEAGGDGYEPASSPADGDSAGE